MEPSGGSLQNCRMAESGFKKMRKVKFETGEYYHIYNRGVDKREIFGDEKDYVRFLRSMREFNRKQNIGSLFAFEKARESHPVASEPPGGLVRLIAYCLNPNHYHFLLEQKVDNGISKYMHKLMMGYSQYFNKKFKRSGCLFQGKFKSVAVSSDWQLSYASAYINGNAEIHGIAKAESYQWSSYPDYLGKRAGALCDKKIILKEFDSVGDYRKYANETIKNSRQIKEELKKYSLE
ncbi:hypothetical protein A2303_06355 [Candidatus Falkowbacteria bacterium RIFOXYB2_FULL_47_14]|uniref:Transposase IS200-like domain-containing protein n=1 Tax=Candidatus Falkowbacteria bacterium RIFOXYA2_FULL_47_19 TaxID=1797994 RepID=A0A1F5SF19_9BACT|nr:MAG: hypothetical protein A2227_07720 [Candidatus Falkowbacteria bacterium RIFOXYA2_FULL_47_19]OGF35663.1 MAG: hypothetical protein A2468_04405 [Candidatus Falkowbacteria bacterium RIFOXYC2_FULL_46_15]OGF43376.1 MAG: hypothetical protein A2303_06355 [Candidatus Falkowbacteria bacterium RIFOXYB2_FULL_47_14]